MSEAKNLKNLSEMATQVGLQAAYLEEASDSLDALYDIIENERCQPECETDAAKAMYFLQRLPVFLSVFRVVNRDVRRITGELTQLQNQMETLSMETDAQRGGSRKD